VPGIRPCLAWRVLHVPECSDSALSSPWGFGPLGYLRPAGEDPFGVGPFPVGPTVWFSTERLTEIEPSGSFAVCRSILRESL